MTLKNVQRLLKHYEDLADGTTQAPVGHKDWADVVFNANVRAEEMRARIAHKMRLPKYAHLVNKPKPTKIKAEDGK